MDRVVLEGVTLGDLVYLGSAALAGLVVSLVVRIITGAVKRGLRRKEPTCLRANLIDDVDGALSLLLILFGVYVGLRWQPSLAEYRNVITSAFVIISIGVVLYGAIRAQDDAIRWALGRVGQRTAQGRVVESVTPIATQIANAVVLAMAGLVVLDRLGISIAPLIAGLGVGGLAVALALQGTLTNLFAGLSVTTDGSIRVGDYVELEGGMVGAIDQIGWRTTRVRLLSNNIVFVPNSRLADSITTNFNYPYEEMSVYMQVGVSYFSDLAHVERVTVEVARQVLQETPGAVRGLRAIGLVRELRRLQHQLLGGDAIRRIPKLVVGEARVREGDCPPLRGGGHRDLLPGAQRVHSRGRAGRGLGGAGGVGSRLPPTNQIASILTLRSVNSKSPISSFGCAVATAPRCAIDSCGALR